MKNWFLTGSVNGGLKKQTNNVKKQILVAVLCILGNNLNN